MSEPADVRGEHDRDRDADQDQDQGHEHLAAARIATILRGMPVGRPEIISCSHCRRSLRAGQLVRAYCYRAADGVDEWSVAGLACNRCHEPAQLEAPTLGLQEAVVEATIATRSDTHRQRHRLVLADVKTIASAAPDEATTC